MIISSIHINDTKKKTYLEHQIRMIFKGSCDTESLAITGIHFILKQ